MDHGRGLRDLLDVVAGEDDLILDLGGAVDLDAGEHLDDTLELLTKPSPEYDEMCRNAVKYVNDNYCWKVIMDKFYRLIEEI